jgi:heme-degrading monooxygenase HmoA
MAVMVTYKIEGISEAAYAGMVSALSPKQRSAQGFILHAGAVKDGNLGSVTEVWESEEDSRRWFDENVRPNLPSGVEAPSGTYQQVHTVITP